MNPDKPSIVAAMRAALTTELEAMERVAAMSRDEVGSDQTKSEGKYDTRSTEASYLARGLAFRIAEQRQIVAWFALFDGSTRSERVQAGALFCLEGGDWLFMAPAGGGRVQVEGRVIRIISPSGPLGEALADLEVGDAVEVDTPKGVVERQIVGLW